MSRAALEPGLKAVYTHSMMDPSLLLLSVLLGGPPVITEVAANPVLEVSGEFVEIFNPGPEDFCIAGLSITDGDALDPLLPWDESLHGTFPHAGMLLGTDTIPAEGFALVFELDYPDAPCYDIPPGTVILTTGDHAICNGLAASSDPLTLFDAEGTADSNAVSTCGTPVPSDIWQERDDDGLDGIPFDPGDGNTVERYHWSSPDQDGCWYTGPQGGTPGAHAAAPPDTLNISCDSLWTEPSEPLPGMPFQVHAGFTCWGNTSPSSGSLYLFLDSTGDSVPQPEEILAVLPASGFQPGSSLVLSAQVTLEQGWYLPAALVSVPEDEYPDDDFRRLPSAVGGGVHPVITEVMCNPLDESTGEYIEIFYPGPGVFLLCGCSFTDGDAVDVICEWELESLADPDGIYGCCLPEGRYGIVMDPDYASGMQEYDLAESTLVFTVGNTTIGNGLTGNDPITLYDIYGTAQANVMSTYGTPLQYDDPLMCDDDGLDGIPFDPGEFHSVERKTPDLPDHEFSWMVSPEGGTPGGQADFQDTLDAAVDTVLIFPAQPQPDQPLQLACVVSNQGTVTAFGIEVTLFIDSNADSLHQPNEVVLETVVDSIAPGQADTVGVTISAPQEGYYLAAAGVVLEGDAAPGNDIVLHSFRTGQGVPLVVTEVLCNGSNDDTDEFVEVFYPGPGVFDVTGCCFTDGDALDVVVPWDEQYGILSDPDALVTPYMPGGTFGVILDREYAQGLQPYDFPQGTVVFTTGNTTLGDGLSGNDPITLYSPEGTVWEDVMSLYGTPIQSDDPLMCDDDGLDEIPFDPGKNNSVHRMDITGPDCMENWFASEEGPTPGGPPPFIVEGENAEGLFMECSPPMGAETNDVIILASFINSGTDTIHSGSMTVSFYADADESGTPSPGELVESFLCGTLAPGDTTSAQCQWFSCAGEMLHFAVAQCSEDQLPEDDTLSCRWNIAGPVVVNEIMYSPSPGNPEWVEILNRSSEAVPLRGWTFEDSKDRQVFCPQELALQPDSFAVITSDSGAFREVWPGLTCPVLQPPSWPVLNNSTQQGEEWADIVIIRDSTLQVMDYIPYDDDWGGSGGVSLERTGPQLPGYAASSWSGCSTGGTPGAVNSCAGGGGGGQDRFLDYYPDPFSPDGDGHHDRLTIEMNFNHPENEVTLEVYNVQGRLLLKLLDGDTCGPSRVVTWDGCGGNGARLPVGRYIIYLNSRAKDTGEYREACGVVVLARPL